MSAKPIPLIEVFTRDIRFEAYTTGERRISLAIRDVLAGLIVALVAIPLGVGFAMASGLRPEQGIVAGAIAGILGGLFGGSKYQVYGPTAAFIPLLSSIVLTHSPAFLIQCSLLAGLLIVLMGIFKLGNQFSKIPFSVTVGFTIGIAFTIGVGQLPDVLGSLQPATPHMIEKLRLVGTLLSHINLYPILIALITAVIIRYCYKISVLIPGPLIALILTILLSQTLFHDQTIPLVLHKFGTMDNGLFQLTLPTLEHGAWWAYIQPVLSIVFIASLESVLSARMADRLAGNKTAFNPNQELVGQGLVNMIAPLFNGFPCTGAFARTAASIKAGASSPLASICQGCFIIILVLSFSHYVLIIPMAYIAGLLLYVAVNMIKWPEVQHVFRQGRFHTFLMAYTAIITFFYDLLLAVSTATAIYYVFHLLQRNGCGGLWQQEHVFADNQSYEVEKL